MQDIIRKKAVVSQVSRDHDDKSIVITLEDGSTEVLIISDAVGIYSNEDFKLMKLFELEIGRNINVYIKENTPTMMSMPPKYVPQLIVVDMNEEFMKHKVAYFNEELISADNTVKIGEAFLDIVESIDSRPLIKELLMNQKLLVFYQESTRSIPAIINPQKVIIL